MIVDSLGVGSDLRLGIRGHAQTEEMHQIMSVGFDHPGIIECESRQKEASLLLGNPCGQSFFVQGKPLVVVSKQFSG